jgi:hypothetical protein
MLIPGLVYLAFMQALSIMQAVRGCVGLVKPFCWKYVWLICCQLTGASMKPLGLAPLHYRTPFVMYGCVKGCRSCTQHLLEQHATLQDGNSRIMAVQNLQRLVSRCIGSGKQRLILVMPVLL